MSIHDTCLPRDGETPLAWSDRVLTNHLQCGNCDWGFSGVFHDVMTIGRAHFAMYPGHDGVLAVGCLCSWHSDPYPRAQGAQLTEEVRKHMASHAQANYAD